MQYDYVFDWTMLKQKAAAAASANNPNIACNTGSTSKNERAKTKGMCIIKFAFL